MRNTQKQMEKRADQLLLKGGTVRRRATQRRRAAASASKSFESGKVKC
jgi:hypothetical protein